MICLHSLYISGQPLALAFISAIENDSEISGKKVPYNSDPFWNISVSFSGKILVMYNKIPIFIFFAIFCCAHLSAKTFYIDPIEGDISNSGSIDSPWSTLQQVFAAAKIQSRKFESKPAVPGAAMVVKNAGAPVKPGDTLLLKNGFHGRIYAAEYYNSDYITIMAAPGHTPTVSSVELRSGSKWIVSGLTISTVLDSAYEKRTLFQFSSHRLDGAKL